MNESMHTELTEKAVAGIVGATDAREIGSWADFPDQLADVVIGGRTQALGHKFCSFTHFTRPKKGKYVGYCFEHDGSTPHLEHRPVWNQRDHATLRRWSCAA